jgi:hypothetical protein
MLLEHPALGSFDLDDQCLISEVFERSARFGRRETTPPAGEVLLRRRSIGAKVSTDNLPHGRLRFDRAVGPEPRLWASESNVAAAAGSEAELASKGGGLEHRTPAPRHPFRKILRAELLANPLRQFLARQHLPVEDLTDHFDEVLELGSREAVGAKPGAL